MDLDLKTILIVVIVPTLLTIFLTGPGMWSDKWGWGWFEKKRGGARSDAKAKSSGAKKE
jgi:hypothetical protein